MWVRDSKYPKHQMHHPNCSFSCGAEAGLDSVPPAFLPALLGCACVCDCSVIWDRLLHPLWFELGKKQLSKMARQIPVDWKHKSAWKEDTGASDWSAVFFHRVVGGLCMRFCSRGKRWKGQGLQERLITPGKQRLAGHPGGRSRRGGLGRKQMPPNSALEALLCVLAVLFLNTSCRNGPSLAPPGTALTATRVKC